MKYPGIFKARYPVLRGKDWIRTVDPEDKDVLVYIGLEEADHGRLGGEALYEKRGYPHMSYIGRVGACVSNVKRWWKRRTVEEAYDQGVLIYEEGLL